MGIHILSTILCKTLARRTIHPHTTKRALHLAPPFLVEDHEPVAQKTARKGLLAQKRQLADEELSKCYACPRDCGVNRLEGKHGVCNTGRKAIVSSAFPHFGEETVLQGWRGSGTIFFSMCNMRCVFCQNWDISQKKTGWELDAAEIADLMLKLQNETKCHNINFVTPEHVAPQVCEAIALAVEGGLELPIVYNTSAYDGLRSLQLMDGLVDIYMPDFKFWDPGTARRLAKAKNYPQVAKPAIKEMHRQVGDLVFDINGLAKRGVLLRHLLMPGQGQEARSIMEWVAGELSMDCYVHLMEQYRPAYRVGKEELNRAAEGGKTRYDDMDRPIMAVELASVKAYARQQGLWRFEEPTL